MIRVYILLLLALLLAAYLTKNWLKKLPAETVPRLLKKTAWLAALLLVGVLALTGKLNWLFAVFGVTIAFMLRLMPVVLSLGPQLHKLWTQFNSAKYQDRQSSQPGRSAGLSKAEALAILGLKPGAGKEEILEAHRKLISRMHPDKGGSDYLAAQINLAKKILLER
jgi:hypothetical protein